MNDKIPIGIRKSIFSKAYDMLNKHRIYYYKDIEVIEKRDLWQKEMLQRKLRKESEEKQIRKERLRKECQEIRYERKFERIEKIKDLRLIKEMFLSNYIFNYLDLDRDKIFIYNNSFLLIQRKDIFTLVEKEKLYQFVNDRFDYEVVHNFIKVIK